MDLIKELNKETLQNEVPSVQIGDTVRVHVKVKVWIRKGMTVPAQEMADVYEYLMTHSMEQAIGEV